MSIELRSNFSSKILLGKQFDAGKVPNVLGSLTKSDNSKFPTFSGFSDNLDLHRSPRSISFRLVEICGRSEKEDLFPVLGNGMSA